MRSNLLIAALLLACGAAARAQAPDTGSAAASRAARRAARRAYNAVPVNAKADWKGWLGKNFPDASKSWPEDGLKAFDAVSTGTWDFVGKGDIDRDGAPTGLLMRVKDSPRRGRLIVADLQVVEWRGGKWETLLRLGADEGVTVGGVKPGAMQSKDFRGYDVRFSAGHPAQKDALLEISAAAVDADGRVVTEDSDFHYLPDQKKYGGEAN